MSIGSNDYPYAGQCPADCGQEKPIGQGVAATCECVSFILWRLANDLHVHLGQGYNDAETWAQAARNNGIRVDGTPGVHSVLCLTPGQQGAAAGGHVALVLEVGPSAHAAAGHVWVEQYNGNVRCNYSQQQWADSPGAFIHFADGPDIHYEGFTVEVIPYYIPAGQGLHVHSGPGLAYPTLLPDLHSTTTQQCDAWTYGDSVWDKGANDGHGAYDRRWYHVVNRGWIASALVDGNAPGSTP